MRPFLLPDLGEGLHEAEVVEWHVAPGDAVAVDDPLVTVETDKALTDIPAPWAGTVAVLRAAAGERVAVGAALVEFDLPPLPGQAAEPGAPPAAVAPAVAAAGPAAGRPPALPAVRALAAELGVDLASVRGSGPHGTIGAADVATAFRAGATAAAPRDGFEPLTATRRAMAEAMARSHAQVVPATVMDEARVGIDGADIAVRLVRALCAAARAEPALNAWFDPTAGVRRHADVHVGLAVDAGHGLVVPVLRDAGSLAPDAVRAGIDRLAAAVRDRTATAADLAGATITLSSFGRLGGRFATPVVTPPQVAILGAGRLRDGLLPLSLTFDHRAVTGGEAARFLAATIEDLEREG